MTTARLGDPHAASQQMIVVWLRNAPVTHVGVEQRLCTMQTLVISRCIMRFGITAKELAKCMLKYYRISE